MIQNIWALGVILYEMCAREKPFKAKSYPALVLKIVESKHEPIPSQYSSELRRLIDEMLNKDPKLRPTIDDILGSPLIKPVAEKIKKGWG